MGLSGQSIYYIADYLDYRTDSLKVRDLYRYLLPWETEIQYLVNKYKLGVF